MQNSADLNEQQAWGSSSYHPHSATGHPGQTTLVGRQGTPLGIVPSHAGILASASNNFFHPTSFPVHSSVPYRLPDVPVPHHIPLGLWADALHGSTRLTNSWYICHIFSAIDNYIYI